MCTPVKIDCKNLRVERQRENNKLMFHALISQDEVLVRHLCNNNELGRVIKELNYIQPITLQGFLQKCNADHLFAMGMAGRISKLASRQAAKDEAFILKKCDETASQVGITIENLTTTAFRPTKDGRILNNKEYKKSGLKKNDCLKSFDARITGKISGWVFAKVAFGRGGHQDNIFSESNEFGEWVQKYGQEHELYVILIDTNQITRFQELKEKFNSPNILVCDHYEFQLFLLKSK